MACSVSWGGLGCFSPIVDAMPPRPRPARERLLALVPAIAIPGDDCILWPRKPHEGTGYAIFYDGQKQRGAHALVYELFVGPLPPGADLVRHTCDVRHCVNPRHLVPGTYADNVRDMHERNRARKAQGEAASGARLTQQQVDEIRAKYVPGVYGYRKLAKEYGVGHPTIRAIVLVISWREVA